jgi:hypothetical protein
MCRGRHRVENRAGEVQARGGAGRGGAGRGGAGRGGAGWGGGGGGVVTYFADRIGAMVQMLLLSPENVLLCLCELPFLQLCSPTALTSPRSNPNLAKAVRPSLISRGRSCRGGKRPRGSRERAPVYVQCETENNDEAALQQLPSNFAISFEDRLALTQVEVCEGDCCFGSLLRAFKS